MNPISIFFKGIWDTFRLFRMWLMLFLLIFVLAATVAIPFANVMQQTIGNSLELNKLLPEYDHTVWSDFTNVSGGEVYSIFGQNLWMAPLFLLLYIFLSGGMVKSFDAIPESFSFQRFWSASTYYFWRFFRLFAWLLLFQGVLAAVIYGGAYWATLDFDLSNLRDETILFNAAKIAIPVHLFLATIIAMIGDYTKVRMVKNDTYFVLREFLRSTGMCFRYFFRTYFVYLLDIALLVGLYFLYLFLAENIGMASTMAILTMIGIQTLTMFFRLGTRLFALGSANAMYDKVAQASLPVSEEEQASLPVSEEIVETTSIASEPEPEPEEEDFDEEDQDFNEREHITDWSPYSRDGEKL